MITLGKLLDLNLKFNDFSTEENGKSYTVLDLDSKPSFVSMIGSSIGDCLCTDNCHLFFFQICLGEGINQKNARDLAATYGIQKLYTLGLLDNLLDKSKDIR